jgi:hypothetical protein
MSETIEVKKPLPKRPKPARVMPHDILSNSQMHALVNAGWVFVDMEKVTSLRFDATIDPADAVTKPIEKWAHDLGRAARGAILKQVIDRGLFTRTIAQSNGSIRHVSGVCILSPEDKGSAN